MSKKTERSIGPRPSLPVATGGRNNAHSCMMGWQKAARVQINPVAQQNNRQKTNLFMTQITGPVRPPPKSSGQHLLTREQLQHYKEWNASMEEKEHRVMPAGTASALLSPSFVKIIKEWKREPTQEWIKARSSLAGSTMGETTGEAGMDMMQWWVHGGSVYQDPAATSPRAWPLARRESAEEREREGEEGDGDNGGGGEGKQEEGEGEEGGQGKKDSNLKPWTQPDSLATTQISIMSVPEPRQLFRIDAHDINRKYLEETMRSHRMVRVKETPRCAGLVPAEEKHFGKYDCAAVYRSKVLPYAWEKRTTGPKWTKLSKKDKKLGVKVEGEGFKEWIGMKDEAERRLHGQFASFSWTERDPHYKFPIQGLSPRGKGVDRLTKIKPLKDPGDWVHPIVTPRSRYGLSVQHIEHMHHHHEARKAVEQELTDTIRWAQEQDMTYGTQALAVTEDYRRRKLMELANTLQTFEFDAGVKGSVDPAESR